MNYSSKYCIVFKFNHAQTDLKWITQCSELVFALRLDGSFGMGTF